MFDPATPEAGKSIRFDLPDTALIPATITLQMPKKRLREMLANRPDVAFGARWSIRGEEVAVAPLRSLRSIGAAGADDELSMLELIGSNANQSPARLLPGRYSVEILWRFNPDAPVAHNRRFDCICTRIPG